MSKTVAAVLLVLVTLGNAIAQNHVLSLNGTTAYVDLPQAIVRTDTFSIEAWVYLNGPGGGEWGQSMIFEQRTDGTGCNRSAVVFTAERRPFENLISFTLRSDADCGSTLSYDRPPYGEWHYYTAVRQGMVSYVYLNGILLDSLSFQHEGNFDTAINHISLGKHTHDQLGYGYMNGMMDEVRIWDVALTSSQVAENMAGDISGTESGLIAYWDFEESTTSVLDQSDHGHEGILVDGAEIILEEGVVDPPIWGDLNQDGAVDISDVIILIDHILGN